MNVTHAVRPQGEIGMRVARAASVYSFRRRRAAIFADLRLVAEPAHDIMLELYIAYHEGRRVTVTDACNATDAPYATALRRLWMLEERGYVRRSADCMDRRRGYVALDPSALDAVDRLLDRN